MTPEEIYQKFNAEFRLEGNNGGIQKHKMYILEMMDTYLNDFKASPHYQELLHRSKFLEFLQDNGVKDSEEYRIALQRKNQYNDENGI